MEPKVQTQDYEYKYVEEDQDGDLCFTYAPDCVCLVGKFKSVPRSEL